MTDTHQGSGAPPAQPGPQPTDAEEPPWPDWFSCEDCGGWFYAPQGKGRVAYESGQEVCESCAEKRERAATALAGMGPTRWKLGPLDQFSDGGEWEWCIETLDGTLVATVPTEKFEYDAAEAAPGPRAIAEQIVAASRLAGDRATVVRDLLLEAARYASKKWSSCSHYRGCLPGGSHPCPPDKWCANCRIIHAVDATYLSRETP